MTTMEPFFVDAVYQDGVLKPAQPLNLADKTRLQLLVLPEKPGRANQPAGSLFGAFPELAAFTSDDIDWAASLWRQATDKQASILRDQE